MLSLLRRRIVPVLLTIFGTAALLYSWAYEKHELGSASDEVNRLVRSQLVIASDEIARDQWLIALNHEVAHDVSDPEVLAVLAHGALDGFVRWYSHMEMRVARTSDQYQLNIGVRDAVLARAKLLAAAKNYPALLESLRQLSTLAKTLKATERLDDQYFAQIAAARKQVSDIESRVTLWYFLGTISLLLGSTIASLFPPATDGSSSIPPDHAKGEKSQALTAYVDSAAYRPTVANRPDSQWRPAGRTTC